MVDLSESKNNAENEITKTGGRNSIRNNLGMED
jgi:hypothetical protein